jgi:glycosyltransferase involved in cell wall biosynthesis
MKRRMVYVSASTLPSSEANAVHVAQMCDAFAGLGLAVELRAARGAGGAVQEHYCLRHAFHIRNGSRAANRLWLLGRRLGRAWAGGTGTLYYGRKLPALSRLAAWGYPTGVELHHPPRTERQAAALRGLVAARGFLGLVAISERLRAELLARLPGLDPERVLVAHDAVRADRIVAPRLHERGPLRAVYCGSLHAGKGMETLLPVAALVPEVAFEVIGGEAAQIDALRAQAPPNLRFLGALPHDQCQRRLADYDIALAPYGAVVRGVKTPEHESLAAWMSPIKLFEYMGAGLPIVTSDLPALREILRDRATALMPPPDDAPAHAAAIRALAGDPALRLRLARAAQDELRGCTWERRAARILEFLEAGLGRRGARR